MFSHWKGILAIQRHEFDELREKYQQLYQQYLHSQKVSNQVMVERPKLLQKLERYLEITGSMASVMRYQATLYKCFSSWSHYSYLQKLRRMSSWPELWRLSKLCPDESLRSSYKPSDVMIESANRTLSPTSDVPNNPSFRTPSSPPSTPPEEPKPRIATFSPMPTPILSQLLPVVNNLTNSINADSQINTSSSDTSKRSSRGQKSNPNYAQSTKSDLSSRKSPASVYAQSYEFQTTSSIPINEERVATVSRSNSGESRQQLKRSPLTVRTDSIPSNTESVPQPNSTRPVVSVDQPPELPFHRAPFIPQDNADVDEIIGEFPGIKSLEKLAKEKELLQYDDAIEYSDEEDAQIPYDSATIDTYSTLTSGFSYGGTSTLKGHVASTGDFTSANRLFRKPSNSTLPTMSELAIGEREDEDEDHPERILHDEEGTFGTLTMSLPSPIHPHQTTGTSRVQLDTGEYATASNLFQKKSSKYI